MQKRWTALALAALMLLTASCHRTAEPSGDGSQTPQIGWRPQDTSAQSSASEADPVKPPPAWEEGRTLEDLPDDYNGLELPVQGATGYAPVEMALWADPADRDAAAQAVEDWEKAQEEQKRLEEEQKRLEEEQAKAEAAAQSQSQAQQGGGETAAPAEPAAMDAMAETAASLCRALCQSGYAYHLAWGQEQEVDTMADFLEALPRMLRDGGESARLPQRDYGRLLYLSARPAPPLPGMTALLWGPAAAATAGHVLPVSPEHYREDLQTMELDP